MDSLCEVLRFLLGKGSNGIFIELFFFRVYLWHDDKGKKITKTNVSAPQYIDYVMSCCHNYLHDDAVFPTKYGEFKEKGGGEFKKTCREHIIVKTKCNNNIRKTNRFINVTEQNHTSACLSHFNKLHFFFVTECMTVM